MEATTTTRNYKVGEATARYLDRLTELYQWEERLAQSMDENNATAKEQEQTFTALAALTSAVYELIKGQVGESIVNPNNIKAAEATI